MGLGISEKKGKLIIVAAPSGAGKTTIVHYLLSHDPRLAFSVSACTRKRRENETDGKDYHFISVEEFRNKISNNEFIEWEEVYKENYYGSLKSEVERLRNEGKTVLFDVDVKGALNIKKQFGDEALSVFIKPPSVEVLIERLQKRGTEDERSFQKRKEKITEEMEFENQFDQVILNDDLQTACNDTQQIVNDFLIVK